MEVKKQRIVIDPYAEGGAHGEPQEWGGPAEELPSLAPAGESPENLGQALEILEREGLSLPKGQRARFAREVARLRGALGSEEGEE